MNRTKTGFILVLIGGILSLIYGVALIIINIIAKVLSDKMIEAGAMPEAGFMGMGTGTITSMLFYNPLAFVTGAMAVIFGIVLIIGANWTKKTETRKKGAIMSIILGLIGPILSWFWLPSSNLLPIIILIGVYVITIIGGILAFR